MFDLKRPCKECPFRRSMGHAFTLPTARMREIVGAPAFQCHKTPEYYEDDEGPFINIEGEDFDDQWRPVKNDDRAQQCAGLMAMLHAMGQPNQIMQVAQRLTGFDAGQIDASGVYANLDEALAGHSA